MIRKIRRATAIVGATALLAVSASSVAAHTHSIGHNGQVLANGQNHPAFNPVTFESCITNALPANYGPAWFGLETAHHGPDSGDPGKGDGCYKADASPLSEIDDVNPAID